MEEKGVRDRKREPEEYNFDYEELADAEVDSEQAGRRDDAVWETTCDTEDPYTVESEDFTEDEDYGEYPDRKLHIPDLLQKICAIHNSCFFQFFACIG